MGGLTASWQAWFVQPRLKKGIQCVQKGDSGMRWIFRIMLFLNGFLFYSYEKELLPLDVERYK